MDKILLVLALVIPCLPKIYIFDGVQMYPFEILMFAVFSWYIKYIKTNIQKTLLFLWLFVFISTIISCFNYVAFGGLLRCIKEIIYIPLLYIALKNTRLQLKHLCYIFVFASIGNILYIISAGFSFGAIDIWDSEVISSGLNNKVFDIKAFSLTKLENAGAHGIWGNYCALIACVSFLAYEIGQISIKKLSFVMSFVVFNIAISVSREALVCFMCVVSFYFYSKYGFTKWLMIPLFLFFFAAYYIVDKYGDYIAIVQKVRYMSDSIADTGQETNIQLRLNGWYVYFISLLYHPWAILIGYGFNIDNYEHFLDFPECYRMDKTSFVMLPESFFVETLYYGGIGAFIYGIRFWRCIYRIFSNIPYERNSIIMFGLFVGLLIANIVSGASIISDLMYSQFLIFIGIVLRDYHLLVVKK